MSGNSDLQPPTDWWIFVDLEAAVQAGTGQDSTLELSIVLAASLVNRALREHRRVGLALAGPKLILQEPRSGIAHRWSLMRTLSMAGAGEHSLTQLLSLAGPMLTASLIVITPSSNPTWVAAIERGYKHGGVTALLVDSLEFGRSVNTSTVFEALTRRGIPHTKIPTCCWMKHILHLQEIGANTQVEWKPPDVIWKGAGRLGRAWIEQSGLAHTQPEQSPDPSYPF